MATKDPASIVEWDIFDIGQWMKLSEEKCLRVGNLKSRMLEEKKESAGELMKKISMTQDQDEGGGQASHKPT